MSKRDKLRRKLKNNPIGVNYATIETLLLSYGFDWLRTTGSHRLFRHPAHPTVKIIIPVHGNHVKPAYVREIIRILDTYFPEYEMGGDDENA